MNIDELKNCEAIICSDIHIRDEKDPKFRKVCAMLDTVSRLSPNHLFLLGDIFDFCLGRSRYFHAKFADIGKRLTQISAAGTRVVFFEGNHEFDASDLPWDGVEFIFEGDHIFEMDSGTRILLAHGDLVYSHRMYKAFRGLVKTRLVKSVASALPGTWMDRFALGNADISRHADNYRTLDHADIQRTVAVWADRYNCDHAFFGHLHYPYGFKRESGGWIASCGSWDQPTILAIRDGQIYRSEFAVEDTDFEFHPLQENTGISFKR